MSDWTVYTAAGLVDPFEGVLFVVDHSPSPCFSQHVRPVPQRGAQTRLKAGVWWENYCHAFFFVSRCRVQISPRDA